VISFAVNLVVLFSVALQVAVEAHSVLGLAPVFDELFCVSTSFENIFQSHISFYKII
jgi:hypothetical protein